MTAHGADSLTVPPNQGGFRAIYLVPGFAAAAGLGIVFAVVRRWKRRGDDMAPAVGKPGEAAPPDEYDAKLDEELKKLDG